MAEEPENQAQPFPAPGPLIASSPALLRLHNDAQYRELWRRAQAADRAVVAFQRLIRTTSNMTPELAVQLVYLYGSYYYEWRVHRLDLQNRIDEFGLDKADSGVVRVTYVPTRFEGLEEALLKFSLGDYQPMKLYLVDVWSTHLQRFDAPNISAPDEVALAAHMLHLTSILPDTGREWTPPTPAWQDPRFTWKANAEQLDGDMLLATLRP